MRYVKLQDVCATLRIDSDLLNSLVAEGLIEVKHTLEDDVVISFEDAERLRVGAMLLREMEVNLAGVEIILHMREELVAMQQQFHQILETLAEELRRRQA
jgi:MerR family transcriptional regulator, heat shock protein HspR